MNEKIYAKVFNLTGCYYCLEEEEFELFRRKFETIRALYYDKNIKHDCYNNFRAIIKEIKRAAHNAGLEAKLLKVDYEFAEDGNIILHSDKYYDFNLVVYFKSAEEYNRRNSFVITEIKSGDYKTGIFCYECNGILEPNKYILPIDDDARDGKDITYKYEILKEDNKCEN